MRRHCVTDKDPAVPLGRTGTVCRTVADRLWADDDHRRFDKPWAQLEDVCYGRRSGFCECSSDAIAIRGTSQRLVSQDLHSVSLRK